MDFNHLNLDRISVDFKDLHAGNQTQRKSVEVVLITKSSIGSSQQCYVLKNDKQFTENDVDHLKDNFHLFHENDFIHMGEILSVNKQNKVVYLKDQNTIAYNHMIIAFSSHYSLLTYEFVAGVNTLVDAIRVRKKIPSAFAKFTKSTYLIKKLKSPKLINSLVCSKRIESIKSRKFASRQESSYILNSSLKNLYEVQL